VELARVAVAVLTAWDTDCVGTAAFTAAVAGGAAAGAEVMLDIVIALPLG